MAPKGRQAVRPQPRGWRHLSRPACVSVPRSMNAPSSPDPAHSAADGEVSEDPAGQAVAADSHPSLSNPESRSYDAVLANFESAERRLEDWGRKWESEIREPPAEPFTREALSPTLPPEEEVEAALREVIEPTMVVIDTHLDQVRESLSRIESKLDRLGS